MSIECGFKTTLYYEEEERVKKMKKLGRKKIIKAVICSMDGKRCRIMKLLMNNLFIIL